MATVSDYIKVRMIIESCKTFTHVAIARNVYYNFIRKYPNDDFRKFLLSESLRYKKERLIREYNLKENDDG